MYKFHTLMTKEYDKELREAHRYLSRHIDFCRWFIVSLIIIMFIIMKAWVPLAYMILISLPFMFQLQISDLRLNIEKKYISKEEVTHYKNEYELLFTDESIIYNHLIRKTEINLKYSALRAIVVKKGIIVITTFSKKYFAIERNQVKSENELFAFIESKNPNIQIYR